MKIILVLSLQDLGTTIKFKRSIKKESISSLNTKTQVRRCSTLPVQSDFKSLNVISLVVLIRTPSPGTRKIQLENVLYVQRWKI